MKISLCMIVKNEEKNIDRCLVSAREIADEIIIVDTGSTDNTLRIVRSFTNNIYHFEWIDDFSAARNFAYSKANYEYIMWLDADDVILEPDRKKLLELKKTLSPDVDVVMLKYNIMFDEKNRPIFSYYRERITKRENNFMWREPVHEYLQVSGKIVNKDIAITHTKTQRTESDRNLKIYEKIISSGQQLSARGQYYFARELKDNKRYNEAINQFEDFLKNKKGWQEDNINASKNLSDCYWQLGQKQESLESLFNSFAYDTPRAEICMSIAQIYKESEDFPRAIFWYELIFSLKKPENNWGFINHDSWGYAPALELVVCYDKLKDYKKAEHYNEIAGQYKPDSYPVNFNRKYFKNLNK